MMKATKSHLLLLLSLIIKGWLVVLLRIKLLSTHKTLFLVYFYFYSQIFNLFILLGSVEGREEILMKGMRWDGRGEEGREGGVEGRHFSYLYVWFRRSELLGEKRF
jgi:hypothetical protein